MQQLKSINAVARCNKQLLTMNALIRTFIAALVPAILFACEPGHNTPEAGFSFVEQDTPFTQTGEASYYANVLEGQRMASGDRYRRDSLVAAHRTLPLGTIIEVTNLDNGKTVEVEVLDRGPHVKGRIVDLSRSAARKLGFVNEGLTEVELKVIEPAEGYSVRDSTAR
jgi:rare lipoprotein A